MTYWGPSFSKTPERRDSGSRSIGATSRIIETTVTDPIPTVDLRLPIGHFILEPVGGITSVSIRLDLWNSELRGEVTTDEGRIGIHAVVHADEMAIVIQLDPSLGEEDSRWH